MKGAKLGFMRAAMESEWLKWGISGFVDLVSPQILPENAAFVQFEVMISFSNFFLNLKFPVSA